MDAFRAILWPVTALLAILVLATETGARVLRELLRKIGIHRVSAFGVEFELTQEAAPKIRDDFEERFGANRAKVRREFDRMARAYRLAALRDRVFDSAVRPNLSWKVQEDVRATIHVPDVLFKDAYYQLLDYYPGGKGEGRSFPIRLGIVGRAFRSGENDVRDDVHTDDAMDLILHWGMTRREAAGVKQGRRFFLCAVLGPKEDPTGVFYLDSGCIGAFGPDLRQERDNKLLTEIVARSEELGLTKKLEDLGEKMRLRGPLIRIFDED